MPASVSEIFRKYGDKYLKDNPTRYTLQHKKVIRAISLCRTGELGSSIYQCRKCLQTHSSFASCGNRHCSQCQGHKTLDWIKKQESKRLPIEYFFMGFTIPAELRPLLKHLQAKGYRLMFKASAEVIKDMMANSNNLGVNIVGFTSMLHTWGSQLQYHPHIHVLLAGGGIDSNGNWKPFPKGFGLVVRKASKLWRAKLLSMLEKLVGREKIPYRICSKEFVVHSESVGSGSNVVKYLSRYLFKVGIDDRRIISVKDGKVYFKYKNWYKDKKGKDRYTMEEMFLTADKFIRRFLQHVLPSGFVKVRHYGFLHSNTSVDLKMLRIRILKFSEDFLNFMPNEEKKSAIKHQNPRCKKCKIEMDLVYTLRESPFLKSG